MISYIKQENPSKISKLTFRIIKISNNIIDYINRELPPIFNNDFLIKDFLYIFIYLNQMIKFYNKTKHIYNIKII